MATAAEISNLYQQYLGREPDAGGLEFYLNPDFSIDLIENDIRNSPEAEAFRAREFAQGAPATREEIGNLYQEIFGREADQGGLDFYDTSDFSPDQIRQIFLDSPEREGMQARSFAEGNPATVDEINALYRDVFGRDADKEGLQFYDASDFSTQQIRDQLLKSPEYSGMQARKYATGTAASRDQINQLYRDILGRDADKEGLQFYESSRFSPDQIAAALRGSGEMDTRGVQTVGGTGSQQLFGAGVPYQSELIRSLREASAGPQSTNPGVTMLANQAAPQANADWRSAFQRPAPAPAPVAAPAPAPTPAPAPPPAADPSTELSFGQTYFNANPDVANAFQTQVRGMTPDEYALYHWNNFGANEGRQGWTGPTDTLGQLGDGDQQDGFSWMSPGKLYMNEN